jgi:membrane associated rhomboid family serine protease
MNYAIIVLNMAVYIIGLAGVPMVDRALRVMNLDASLPEWHQFITYQFIHASTWHLIGNLWFLWVFGNSVNGKLGNWSYLFFYLAGGIIAGWGFALSSNNLLVGASGSIAAVTTAFMVFFPRSRILFLFFIFIITTFELQTLWVVLFKIVLWDNVLAPAMHGSGQVATSAHLFGYAWGFFISMGMLLFNLVSRDQFDLLALIRRWNQRREFAVAMRDPHTRAQAQLGTAARTPEPDAARRREVQARLDRAAELRNSIQAALGDPARQGEAIDHYEQLIMLDPDQVLSRQLQLALARQLYATRKYPQAAGAFEKYIKAYPRAADLDEVRLLLGIIYARDLEQYEIAKGYLTDALARLVEPSRKQQCQDWLDRVLTALQPRDPGPSPS